jgi:hypothetical protein
LPTVQFAETVKSGTSGAPIWMMLSHLPARFSRENNPATASAAADRKIVLEPRARSRRDCKPVICLEGRTARSRHSLRDWTSRAQMSDNASSVEVCGTAPSCRTSRREMAPGIDPALNPAITSRHW